MADITRSTRDWYYILKGHRAVCVKDVLVWGRWFEESMTNQMRKVGLTELNDKKKTYVSTVFLGLDQSFGLSAKPILFETMVFDKKGRAEIMERYHTWGEAAKGHDKYVRIETEKNKSSNR